MRRDIVAIVVAVGDRLKVLHADVRPNLDRAAELANAKEAKEARLTEGVPKACCCCRPPSFTRPGSLRNLGQPLGRTTKAWVEVRLGTALSFEWFLTRVSRIGRGRRPGTAPRWNTRLRRTPWRPSRQPAGPTDHTLPTSGGRWGSERREQDRELVCGGT